MLFPGIGEYYVSGRMRLLFAMSFALLMAPVLQEKIPPLPHSIAELSILLISEIFVGFFFGILTRILLSVTHITGMIIAAQSALSAATLFDANQGAQGAIVGNFFSALVIVLIFASNMHHVFIGAIFDSYNIFTPGDFLSDDSEILKGPKNTIGDMAYALIHVFNESFNLSFKLSSPFIVVGLVMFLAGGILSRLMPSMQIFFIITPAQMLLSFFIIMITISFLMENYLEHITETILGIFNSEY